MSASLLKLQRTLDFLSLRNLASSELFFTILSDCNELFLLHLLQQPLFYIKKGKL
ncbi:hypothetical protein C7Y58_00540 [Fusobacterium nucleatum subsp. nucleatum ATCC 25586]|uniref:Riboflavin synthase subunit alpha n=1 Tax=Fusobacterium nucleatum subsp. nucleatum (strain ATCC 25586 / DSM 15643 / BCRC 10681 / CIP 101130 / JCM 8532 / KCTC 2640 / LMG 13131 / VPI 4355) TaxID=190304 RepID=Q8RII9_FUSNN|nr:unknown [Fusobacterium nucleatum subsp. nucleatum ATCC 25586]ASG27215.1 hypothetical protein RN84_00250 [Fusobacterium nucleatum subsp. nucleatum]AVQ15785.1 hypothetical protein C7Y58_00540 [Fusobacterium nucleatum subsp. nucleatum ATCC 25586]AVQ23987.1 hypothetical protein C4N14_00580 [Fusobacterium nucleatum subsp. nucleatum ATCC 23726]